MADATLRKLVTEKAVADAAIIDDLVKSSGILQTALVLPSSHGKFHKYKKVSALPTASFRSIGGTYTDQTIDNEIHQLDLKMCGVVQSEDKAICDEIGVRKYFMDNRPAIMEALGQKMATGIIYGTNSSYGDVSGFIGLHDIADAYGSSYYTDCGGATSTTSIFVVKYARGRSGLVYNSKTVGAGSLIKTSLISGGNPVLEYIGSGTKKPVYQILYETDLAWLAASALTVHALVGVDESTNAPTDLELKKAIDSVKGTAADTFIYTSRMGKRAIESLNNTAMDTTPMNDDFNTLITRYAGIPIVVDENILETEAIASLPYGLT